MLLSLSLPLSFWHVKAPKSLSASEASFLSLLTITILFPIYPSFVSSPICLTHLTCSLSRGTNLATLGPYVPLAELGIPHRDLRGIYAFWFVIALTSSTSWLQVSLKGGGLCDPIWVSARAHQIDDAKLHISKAKSHIYIKSSSLSNDLSKLILYRSPAAQTWAS